MELQTIQNKIYEIRGLKVMLDFDLAEMYGTETAQLKRAVRRNIERFEGDDFMFELTKEELSRCQFGILNKGRGSNFKYKPFAFTELGVAMLSSVLNSKTAIEINRNIMRAFVAIRNYTLQTITSSIEIKELQERIKSLEMANEETLCAINDLSEDTQKSLDDIYIALSELATKKKNNAKKPKIGYIKYSKLISSYTMELQAIQNKIYEIRGQKVMLDFDLAEMYGTETAQLKRAVRRNIERFPDDFMFTLTIQEFNNLKNNMVCQIGISKKGGNQYAPFAFTEQGIAMLSSVLRSDTAIKVNISIMRAFVGIRQIISSSSPLLELQQEVKELKAYIEEAFADYNDINEDTRTQLELINLSLAELQARRTKNQSRPRIGYVK